MKIFLLGRIGGITHWLEDAVAAFRGDGHEVRLGIVRRPWLNADVERALQAPLAAAIARRVERCSPDLILAIGGFHVPEAVMERLGALRCRPPLVGWVGDRFDHDAGPAAAIFDLVAYTDSRLLARHEGFGFASPAIWLPHAVNPHTIVAAAPRTPRMVFVANPTPMRARIVNALASPIVLHGPGWKTPPGTGHHVHAGRVTHRRLARIYAGHLASLNVRNELNVLAGLNQRSFDPYLSATPVASDDQADLSRCFVPGEEVMVWRETGELNELYARMRDDPAWVATIGQRGRRRVLAQHTFARRLETVLASL